MNKTDIWCFQHEPDNIEDMVLNDDVRDKLNNIINQSLNVTLVGPAGVGKGTFTHIFLKQSGFDYIWVNCSDETSVENMRTKVKSFATALGTSKLKMVVLNEADYLSPNAMAMLRDLIEQVHSITRFILMCNYGHKLLPEITSRCPIVEMGSPPLKDIAKFVMGVLKKENVKIEKLETIIETIKKLYPDIRTTLNTLQLNTIDGKISSVKFQIASELYKNIFDLVKKQDLDGIRKTLRSNTTNYTELYQYIFDNVGDLKSPGDAIIETADAMYRDSLVAIKEINFIGYILKLVKKGCI